MEKERPQIEIPETGALTPSEVKAHADSKFKDINYILLSVVVILVIMVATLLIDSFHINSATYKEYSQKTKSVEMIQEANEELLNQNRQNQSLIIELQKQILEFLTSK